MAEMSEKLICKTGISKQVIFALIVAASNVEVGLVNGWPQVLPKIQTDNSTRLNVTDEDVAWLESLPRIAGVALPLFVGPLMEAMGPRRLLLVSLLPVGIPFLAMAFTPHLSFFLLSRVLTCVTFAVLGPVTAVLVTEMCEPRIRGFLLSASEIFVATGQIFITVMAVFLPWDVATALCAVPVFLFGLLAFLVPESPYWLTRRNQKDAAIKSVKSVRDPSDDINLELYEIAESIQERSQTTIKGQNYRPILLLMAVFFLRELGEQYIYFYHLYLFQKAGIALDAFSCTSLVNAVRLFFTFVAAAVMDRVGRRPLLIATTLVCGSAEVVGAMFLLADLRGSPWVPLAVILVFILSFGLGLGPIVWVLLGELIPTPVRPIGISLCFFNFNTIKYIISLAFPQLLHVGIGAAPLFLAFAHAIVAFLLYLFLPETRGRTLFELQDEFKDHV